MVSADQAARAGVPGYNSIPNNLDRSSAQAADRPAMRVFVLELLVAPPHRRLLCFEFYRAPFRGRFTLFASPSGSKFCLIEEMLRRIAMRILMSILFSSLLLIHALVSAAPPFSDPPGKSGSAPGYAISQSHQAETGGGRPPAQSVPEPSTLLLLSSGIVAFGGYQYARFRRNKKH